ncbi:blastoderm-specific protein 25D isoform X2 [Teleopsis dalmanni]|uniref:blastoderm-specific protein 25D isoform X2 n=1 Tax=Teleopsis dalmanni TaxID=139649 RepID=UPI0018CD5743|nr:blastoderm-specific protein 25D isoform X2 [Teleopsis dalmanni]
MEVSSDPYELKLYQMFESCDTESCGLLNQDALRRLCTLLELRDKGAVLIENLAVSGKNQHVSFECFKEALLNFLGTELDGKEVTSVTTAKFSHPQIQNATHDCERVLVISDEVETYVDHEQDLSDREVSPKLVMGTKKYGRRSRPQQHAVDEFSLSDSEDNEYREENRCNKHNGHIVQRSSSHTDIPGTRCRRFTSLNGNKLKRCSSLPAQKTPKPTIAKSKPGLGLNKNTISSKDNQLGSSVESLDAPNLMETISRHTIMDIWEHANISNSKSILLALGCDEDEINVAHLSKVLEEELSNIHDDGESTLWRAALALQSAELSTLRHALRQLHEENLKLRADNKDANRRVTMLAVEIDERHASLEDTSKKEIKMLEQRHAAAVRELTTRMANDREHWTNLTSRLEARIKSFEQDEIRFKTELELARKENTELDGEQQKLSKQVNELIEKNTQLNREINLKQNSTCEEHNCSTTEKTSQDEMLQLIEKIDGLQLENKNLRDKSDELVAEIENLNFEMQRMKAKGIKKSSIATGSNVQGTEENVQLEENEQGNGLSAVKRRGDSPSKTRMTEESPRLGKLRRCGNETGGSENSDTSGEWMALNSELQRLEGSKTVQNMQNSAEVSLLKEQITALEMQVKNMQGSSSSTSVEERCKELETSLEQMQRAYEDCEDYWQSKLSEERQLFEKERQIYEEEQQESDKKFTELMEKVREYEEQFSKDGRLSPIEEKDTLEQQYADLEAEADELRENSRKIFQEKSKEIESLQLEIEDLRLRLGESVEILTGACELSTENAVNCATNINANAQSSASSPISYLWHQSTIQEPNKLYQSLESGDVINISSPTASTNKSLNRFIFKSKIPQLHHTLLNHSQNKRIHGNK